MSIIDNWLNSVYTFLDGSMLETTFGTFTFTAPNTEICIEIEDDPALHYKDASGQEYHWKKAEPKPSFFVFVILREIAEDVEFEEI